MAYALKDSCNTTIINRRTGKPFLYADYLNSASLTIEGESVFAKAKGMNKIAFEGAKTGTFTMETEVFEFKYLALLLGGKMDKGTAKICKRFVGKVNSDKSIVIPGKAIEDSISVFKVERDNKTHIEEVEIGNMSTQTEEVHNTKLTWSSDVEEGDNIAVYYLVQIENATKIKISSEVNNESFRIYGITSMKDEFGEEKLFQFDLFNAKTQVNVELTLSADTVSSFSAKFDLLLDENNNLLELTLLSDDDITPKQMEILEQELVA